MLRFTKRTNPGQDLEEEDFPWPARRKQLRSLQKVLLPREVVLFVC